MLETDIQSEVLSWLKKQKICHWRTDIRGRPIKGGRGKNPMAGFPDLCIVIGDIGRLLCVELKRPGEKASLAQIEWGNKLITAGVIFVVCHSLDEVISAYWKARSKIE